MKKTGIVENTPKYIAVNCLKGIKILEVKKIVYLKAEGRYTVIYLENDSCITVCKNLGHYHNLFQDLDFLRIHNKFLINVAYLSSIVKDGGGQYCIIGVDIMLPISNRKFSDVKKQLYY